MSKPVSPAIARTVAGSAGSSSWRAERLMPRSDRVAEPARVLDEPPARLAQHPRPERGHLPGLLGDRDELGGRHRAERADVPAQQRLDAVEAPVGERVDRLEDEPSSSRSAAPRSALASRSRRATWGRSASSKLTTRSPPARLAAYIAPSARRSTSSGSQPASTSARPTLAVTGMPARAPTSSTAARSRSPKPAAASGATPSATATTRRPRSGRACRPGASRRSAPSPRRG